MTSQRHDPVPDLAVIGSGGAAMAAAIHARRRDASVLLIERDTLGGTCVNVGCVPSKTLLGAASLRYAAMTNPFHGVPTSADGVDLGALVEQKDELIGRLRQAKYADVAEAYGFEVRSGNASFADQDTFLVNGRPVLARAYLIATGAQPAVPDLGLGGIDYLTSTTAMELKDLPQSLVVIGGGYVGMEQSQLFAHLGTKVTVVGRLAPRAEPELASRLRKAFLADGITVVNDRATAVERDGNDIVVVTRSGRRLAGERLLVATGRTPGPMASTSPPLESRPTSAASCSSTPNSAPQTPGCSPPVTSAVPRSTSTSPPPPGRQLHSTRWAGPSVSTTPVSRLSSSPVRSWHPPDSPKRKRSIRATTAPVGSSISPTCPGPWSIGTLAVASSWSPTPTPAGSWGCMP
jgi:thioredoxin reductase